MSENDTYYQEKWKIDAFGKLYYIVFAVVVILVGLVVGFVQKAAVYRIDQPLTSDTVLSLKEDYAGCTVIDHASQHSMHSFLLESESGEHFLVTLEQYGNSDDYRLVGAGTFPVTDRISKAIIGDFTVIRLGVDETAIESYTGSGIGFNITNNFTIPLSSVLYSVLILAAIFGAAAILRKIRR